MYGLPLGKIASIVRGKLIGGQEEIEPVGAAVDIKDLKPQELFYALEGKAGGHDFLKQAAGKGAAAVVLNYCSSDFSDDTLPLIIVEDVTRSLFQTAIEMRRKFRGPVVAIAGTKGKTTTKDLLWSVLSKKGPVLKDTGYYDGKIGLPLTILSLKKEHWAILVEMGIYELGDIDFMARIGEPVYGVITNISHTRQEMPESREKAAQAKAELLSHLPYNGGVVLNLDDKAVLKPWLSNLRCRVDWAGLDNTAQIWASDIVENDSNIADDEINSGISCVIHTRKDQEHKICLQVHGRYNVMNALFAAGMARQLNIDWEDIKIGLESARLRDEFLKNRSCQE